MSENFEFSNLSMKNGRNERVRAACNFNVALCSNGPMRNGTGGARSQKIISSSQAENQVDILEIMYSCYSV